MSEIESKPFTELASDFCANPGNSKDEIFHSMELLLSHPDVGKYDEELFNCFMILTSIKEVLTDKQGMHHLLFQKLRLNQIENEESWFAIFSKFFDDEDLFLADYLNEFSTESCHYRFIWKFVNNFSPNIHDERRGKWIAAIYSTYNNQFDPLYSDNGKDADLFLSLALEGDEKYKNTRGFKEIILPTLELAPESYNADFSLSKPIFIHKNIVKTIINTMNSKLQIFKTQFLESLISSLQFTEKSTVFNYLIIRKFASALISSDLIEKFLQIIQKVNLEYKQQLLLAISFDLKSHEILRDAKIDMCYYEKFSSILGVVFSPLFCNLMDKENIEKYAVTSKTRNSRMKYDGYDAIMNERINEIFTNPVLFERFMNQSTEPSDQKWFNLKLKDWNLEKAMEYLSYIMSKSERSMCAFLNSSSLLQYFLSHHFVINLSFLFENYFNQYIDSKFQADTYLQLFKTGINFIKATPSEFIKTEERRKWLHFVASALSSDKEDIREAGLDAAYQEIGRLGPDSFALAPFVLVAIEDSLTDKQIPFLISLYSIAYYKQIEKLDKHILINISVTNMSNVNKAFSYNDQSIMRKKVIEILTNYIERNSLTDHTLGAASTILFIEMGLNEEPITENVKLLMDKAMNAKIIEGSIRTFCMLSERSSEIEVRFEGFSDMIKSALLKHLRESKLSTNGFGILIESLTDICIRTKSIDFINEAKSLIEQTEHKTEVRACIDRFKLRLNQPLTVAPRPENPDAVMTGLDSMSSITFNGNGIDIVTKHTAGSQMATITPIYEDFTYHISNTKVNRVKADSIKCSELDNDYLPLFEDYSIDLCDPSKFKFKESRIPNDYTRRLYAIRDEPPIAPREDLPKLNVIRQNSAALALYQSVGQKAHVFPPSSISKLLITRIFRELPVRECLKIGCLFVKKGQFEQNDILRNSFDETSDEFRSFLQGIGWLVDLNEHNWNAGKLDQTNFSNGRYQVFFAGERFEAMFHVAPLLPTDPNDAQQIYKKRHIGNDNVHIIFSEHNVDYDPQTVTSQFNDAHVVVYKTGAESLFRSSVFTKNPELQTGPLFGDCVLPAAVVPELVRWTAMFADRSTRISTDSVLSGQLLLESFAECENTQ